MPRVTVTSHLRPGIGKRLRQAREEAGMSQREVSFKGCTSAYISRIEAGARTPSLQVVFELADRIGVDPWWLATGEKSKSTDLRKQLFAVRAERDALRMKLDKIASLAS